MADRPDQIPAQRGGRRPAPKRHSIADRYTPQIATAGFTPVAAIFLETYARLEAEKHGRGLNSTEAMLLIQLLSFKWDSRAPYPRLATLAKRLGVERRTVRGVLKRLEDRGYIRRVRGPNSAVNRFDFTGLFEVLEAQIRGNTAQNAAMVMA